MEVCGRTKYLKWWTCVYSLNTKLRSYLSLAGLTGSGMICPLSSLCLNWLPQCMFQSQNEGKGPWINYALSQITLASLHDLFSPPENLYILIVWQTPTPPSKHTHLPPSGQSPFFSIPPLPLYSYLYRNSLIYYHYLYTYRCLSPRKWALDSFPNG